MPLIPFSDFYNFDSVTSWSFLLMDASRGGEEGTLEERNKGNRL